MDDVTRPGQQSSEVDRIRAIVNRYDRPPFVTGFDVELGEFDDEPSMWIIFHTTGQRPTTPLARKERIDALGRLQEAVDQALRAEAADRFPYYRYRDVTAGASANA